MPDKDTTIDGVPVSKGLRVWDYNIRRAIVGDPERWGNPNEPTWYDMTSGEPGHEGERSSMMDAKRMWYLNPFTGEKA